MKYVSLLALSLFFISCGNAQKNEANSATTSNSESFKINKTDKEWKEVLTSEEYNVLRQEGTERPFSSDLLANKEKGTYVCAACGTPVFESQYKFDSGTGWPSFDREVKGNVAYSTDSKLGYTRKEEHCATCGGHLGHVFNDGPKNTTGERHCINGDALKFKPTKS